MNRVSLVSINLLSLSNDMEFSNENNEGNKNGLPYKLARLVSGKRKYILFYVWDANEQKLSRQRRAITDEKLAKNQIKEINYYLINGYHIQKRPERQVEYTIIDAINVILEIRKKELSKASVDRDKSYFKQFVDFLQNKNLQKLLAKYITKLHIIEFLDYRKAAGVSNRTRNNTLNWIKSILNSLVERGIIQESPANKISNLKETEPESLAFTKEDTKKMKELLASEEPLLYKFCMIIYQCFIRPNEIRNLKVENWKKNELKIFVPATIAKSKKNRYVKVPKKLTAILDELCENKKPTDFLFQAPKGKMFSRNYFSMSFKDFVRKHKFDERYYLYCWKHTGVTEYCNRGYGIRFIQTQCGHSSLEDTAKYLKGLGISEDNVDMDNSPDL